MQQFLSKHGGSYYWTVLGGNKKLVILTIIKSSMLNITGRMKRFSFINFLIMLPTSFIL